MKFEAIITSGLHVLYILSQKHFTISPILLKRLMQIKTHVMGKPLFTPYLFPIMSEVGFIWLSKLNSLWLVNNPIIMFSNPPSHYYYVINPPSQLVINSITMLLTHLLKSMITTQKKQKSYNSSLIFLRTKTNLYLHPNHHAKP